jgi:hypothetical protein
MDWNKWQIHRWLSIALTVIVISNVIALAPRGAAADAR